jgi:hypothetical protein
MEIGTTGGQCPPPHLPQENFENKVFKMDIHDCTFWGHFAVFRHANIFHTKLKTSAIKIKNHVQYYIPANVVTISKLFQFYKY